MIIRPATIMRNDYNLISEYAHQSGEIVYLTKYGKGDLVVMSIKTFEQREEKFKFYHTVMQADLDRQKSAEELWRRRRYRQIEGEIYWLIMQYVQDWRYYRRHGTIFWKLGLSTADRVRDLKQVLWHVVLLVN